MAPRFNIIMRKGFKFIPIEVAQTKVYDAVSAFVPDQSLSLRQIMMQFAYIGNDKLQEIVNRGFDGDEDEDILGVDVGALDFAEVHDRMVDMLESQRNSARAVHNTPVLNLTQPDTADAPSDTADAPSDK